MSDLHPTPTPTPQTVSAWFEILAAARPEALAVVCGDQRLTYGELNERANRTAHTIRRYHRSRYGRDLTPDTPIAIYINQGANMIMGLLAILKAGGAYMPLDPGYPDERLRWMMEDARAPLVITEQALLKQLLFLDQDDYGVITLDAGWDLIAKESADNPQPRAEGRSLAYVLYTSGSTGKPKGVMVEHHSIVNLARGQNYAQIGPDDCIAQSASISFDAATFEIWAALLNGARVAVIDRNTLLSGVQLAAAQRRHGVTIQFFTTAVFNLLTEGEAEALIGLRVALFGGEEANAVKVHQVLARKPAGLDLVHVYGPTECTTFSTCCRLDDSHRDASVIPIGVPLNAMIAYVLDDQLQPVAAGALGELYLGGEGIARGYLHRPELTDQRFIPNPFVGPEDRQHDRNSVLYKTGDLVTRLPSGDLIYHGRADDQIKIRGFRVELGEIETALQAHPAVKDCVVVPFGDYHQKRLIAYVIPVQPGALDPGGLRTHLAQSLPTFMIPAAFIEMAAFPLNPNGKVQRQSLPAPFGAETLMAGAGETGPRPAAACPIAPRTDLERALHDLVAAALHLDSIGVEDSIFDYGAHSLIVAQICAAVRHRLHRTLTPQNVFDRPTVAGLVRLIEDGAGLVGDDESTIPRAPRDLPIPLSFQQEQIWFLSKLAPSNRAYNSQFTVRFAGPLDQQVLQRALQEIVNRHEILRTSFHEQGGVPCQVIHDPWPVDVPEIDLRHLPAEERMAQVEQHVALELNYHFEFDRLPLVRPSLYRIGDAEWVFLWLEHHFIHDGWEVMVFLKELKALYVAFLAGQGSPLPPLPIQYADFAVWQRQRLSGARLDAKVGYWTDKIRDYPQVLNLYTDRPRPPVQGFEGDHVRVNLDRGLYRSLRDFSHAHGVTLFMTMYAAFALLLGRYSGQDRFLVGTGVANRDMQETEDLIGMFVNIVLLYSDLSANPTIAEFLETTRANILEDAVHRDTPFPAIVERLKAGHKADRNPVFQVIFAFHDSAVPVLDFGGLRGVILERHNKTAKADMNLICIPRAEQHVTLGSAAPPDEDLTLVWEYNSDLFERPTIERMVGHYIALLRQVVGDPGRRASDLTLVGEDERSRLLQLSLGPRLAYRSDQTLDGVFQDQAGRLPDKTAVIEGERVLSYAELAARSDRLARAIRRLGLAPRDGGHAGGAGAAPGLAPSGEVPMPGTPVGLCMGRGIDLIVGMLAILKTGGAYVVLPPDYPEQRLRFMLDDARIAIVLTQTAVRRQAPWLWQGPWAVLMADAGETEEESAQGMADPAPGVGPASALRSDAAAYVIYTSGSTGIPKGVVISHRAAHNFVAGVTEAMDSTEADVYSQIANHAFDAATVEIWGALLTGATLAIIDAETVLDPDRLLAAMERPGVTVSFFTTALFNLLADGRPEVLTRLRCAHFGGEMANLQSVRQVLERGVAHLTLLNGYGPTECTTYSTLCPLTLGQVARDIIPIGRPLPNYATYVLDTNGRPVPVGVPGELHIGGDGVANGYLNRPELSAERFIPNPFASDEERAQGRNLLLYKTGDLVRWLGDDNLQILGRLDFQVKIRGFRIEPEEVERVLSKHPGVRQCVVVPWEGNLIAYWVPAGSVTGSAPVATAAAIQVSLRPWLATHLPDYMVPTGIIEVERFELNRNGKIDRTRLPAPGSALVTTRRVPYQAPRTPTQGRLVALWQDLLHLHDIGVDDSFFDLGGNSILTVRMLGLVRRDLGAEIHLASLYALPTVAALAARIDATAAPVAPVGTATEDNLSLALRDAAQVQPWVFDQGAPPCTPPGAVLLTGVTGFLGLHVLEQLLALPAVRVHCLVRAADQQTAVTRLRETARRLGRPLDPEDPRIRLVPGDLARPALGLDPAAFDGLAGEVDHIFHCGAFVHHLFDYRTLQADNVGSVIELLRLAGTSRRKVLNYVSTLSVASVRGPDGRLIEIEPGERPVSTNGYVMTKWVAEQILQRHAGRGLAVNVFRPGNITGHSLTGACLPDKNHALLLVKGCLQLGCAPDWQRPLEMTPVDILARAMVGLALDQPGGGVFNMNNPVELDWAGYLAALGRAGYPCALVGLDEWGARLAAADDSNALYPLRELYLGPREDLLETATRVPTRQGSAHTQQVLRRLGLAYPEDYGPTLRIAIDYLRESGFFPPPVADRATP